MRSIEMTGKTVDDAINNALSELKITKDKVQVEVIDEGSRGLFNIIGTKPAKVIVKVKKDYTYEAKAFLREVLNSMNIKCEIRVTEENESLKINLIGPDMGILIGHRGETLDSLQYLVSLVVNKNGENDYRRVILDTENYRVRREETLKRLAEKMANKVIVSGRSVKLEPMNPYERRIIHSALQSNNEVDTFSEGEEPYRRVVISLKRAYV